LFPREKVNLHNVQRFYRFRQKNSRRQKTKMPGTATEARACRQTLAVMAQNNRAAPGTISLSKGVLILRASSEKAIVFPEHPAPARSKREPPRQPKQMPSLRRKEGSLLVPVKEALFHKSPSQIFIFRLLFMLQVRLTRFRDLIL